VNHLVNKLSPISDDRGPYDEPLVSPDALDVIAVADSALARTSVAMTILSYLVVARGKSIIQPYDISFIRAHRGAYASVSPH
jgi:hypothetical protein